MVKRVSNWITKMTINDGLGVEGEANKNMKSDTRSNHRASLLSNGQGQVVQTPVYRGGHACC